MTLDLRDFKPSPLQAQGRKRASVHVLCVDGACKSLHGGDVPALPVSFRGRLGDRADLATKQGRLLVVGCGSRDDSQRAETYWEGVGAAVIETLRALRVESAALQSDFKPSGLTAAQAMDHFAIGATLAAYRCTAYRSKLPATNFEVASLLLPAAQWKATARARQLAESMNWARALVEAPANLMTPQAFAAEARSLSEFGVRLRVLDLKALEKLGAGGLVAVGRSSEHPPLMLVCEWQGRAGKDFDLGLVGKGLTFDAGGLNLKTAPNISKMKFDMAGAAAVVGALRVLAQRRAAVNVVAAIPLCENVIDGRAYRPGDVITSLSGLTIEVDNTDAEGRIVLADGMSYMRQQCKPARLIDIATLTGAIMLALHEEYAGLFTRDEPLAGLLDEAASTSGESLWRMPLVKRHDYLVESEIADVRNFGAGGFFGVGGGSSIAGAKFLEKFAGDTPWAHLDIASTGWSTRPMFGVQKGATGYGVRLLDALVDAMTKH